MSLKDALVEGLASIPECQTICYVDLTSGLVLASHAHTRRPQEFYDRIGALAAQLLLSPSINSMAQTLTGDAGDLDGRVIYVFGTDQVHAFVKSKLFPDHAICYMCAGTVDANDLPQPIMQNREAIAGAM